MCIRDRYCLLFVRFLIILIVLYCKIVIFTVCCFLCYLMAFDCQELKGFLKKLPKLSVLFFSRHGVLLISKALPGTFINVSLHCKVPMWLCLPFFVFTKHYLCLLCSVYTMRALSLPAYVCRTIITTMLKFVVLRPPVIAVFYFWALTLCYYQWLRSSLYVFWSYWVTWMLFCAAYLRNKR